MSSSIYSLNGIQIIPLYPSIDVQMDAILKSPKFITWLLKFGPHISMTEFTISDVNFFGRNNLGFLKGSGNAVDVSTGKKMSSNIVFIRGGSVAALIIITIKETNEKYVLLCSQLRFPTGSYQIEACAGMLDNSTELTGVIFNEIKEETGFILNIDELISLGSIKPSCGGCDETIGLFAWETTITQEVFEEKQSKLYGENTHESIRLCCFKFAEFGKIVPTIEDPKAECCWRRYLSRLVETAQITPSELAQFM